MPKRRAEHEHHGGAWKVAYSDFITSMMALFMVLWILSQSVEVKESIAKYFLDPFSASVQKSPGIVSDSEPYPKDPTNLAKPNHPVIDVAHLRKIMEEFYRLLNIELNDDDKPVDISLTSDGLFITLFDRDDQPLFIKGTTEFTQWGDFVLQNIAWMVSRHSMDVKVGSHVPQGYDYASENYSAWELTADMSNAVRRELTYYAPEPIDFNRVSGYADRQPISSLPATSEKNQRVELELVLPDTDIPKAAPTPSSAPERDYK